MPHNKFAYSVIYRTGQSFFITCFHFILFANHRFNKWGECNSSVVGRKMIKRKKTCIRNFSFRSLWRSWNNSHGTLILLKNKKGKVNFLKGEKKYEGIIKESASLTLPTIHCWILLSAVCHGRWLFFCWKKRKSHVMIIWYDRIHIVWFWYSFTWKILTWDWDVAL